MSAVPATRELSGGIDYLGRIVSFCVGQGERREVGRDVISVACQKIILCPIFLPLVSVVPILEISYRCSVILLFFFFVVPGIQLRASHMLDVSFFPLALSIEVYSM